MRADARVLLSLILLAATAGAPSRKLPGPAINIRSLPGGVYKLTASISIPAPPSAVWDVVADYDHLADFMPHFDSSRIVSRGEDSVVVRQRGGSTFIITKRVDLTLSFHEYSPDSATFHMLNGSVDRYAGVWRFEPITGGAVDSTRLVYEVEMGNFHVPGMIIRHVIQRDMGEMMPAIAREVARRAAPSSRGSNRP